MPLPERMRPAKVSRSKIKALAEKAEEILSKIDEGVTEEDDALQAMMSEWNSQVISPCAFSDFRDYSSWTDAKEFTQMAFDQEKYYEDFSWEELVQTIDYLCNAEGSESQQNYALDLLIKNFDGNPSDLIFWPNEWFQNPDMLHVELSTEEIAGYLMARSGRQLADAPEIALKYPIPLSHPN